VYVSYKESRLCSRKAVSEIQSIVLLIITT